MYYQYINLILVLLIASGQGIKRCDPGVSCISIRSCPEMIRLVQSGTRENIRKVRESICGFQQKDSLVCCGGSKSTTTTATATKPTIKTTTTTRKPSPTVGKLVDLLPKDCGTPSTADKIFGGEPAPIGAYPWVVAMGYSEPGLSSLQFVCSGTIINKNYVLTAAHCVHPKDTGSKKLAVMRLGDWNLKTKDDCETTIFGKICAGPSIDAGYEEVIIHPRYNKRGKSSDDIALIRLNMTLDFENSPSDIQPVCLPKPDLNVRTFVGERKPVAVGWGLTEYGNSSDVMLRVEVPVVDEDLCLKRYKDQYVGNQLCVGGEGEFDTCSGDSGGPLVISDIFGPPFTLIGIVSFGPFPCGLKLFPGVYTSVVDYRNWILANMKP